VKRRYKNFLALHQELSMKVPKEILPQLPKKKRLGILDPLFVEERRTSLEKYLQDLTALRSCWTCPHFIQFLDDNPPVLFLQMQTAKLNDEVRFLRYQNEVLVNQCQDNATALTSANSMISDLYKRILDWEDHMKRASYYPSERPREHYPTERSHESHYQNPAPADLYSSPSLYSTPPSQTTNHQPFDQTSRTNSHHHHYEVTNNPNHPNPNDHQTRYERPEPIRRRKSLTNIIGSTNVLELLSVCPASSYFDQFGDSILSMILPSYEQLQYRFQVEKFMGKLVRKSLGAQIHQMGIHSLRCFLPDDPISLSIFLCKGLENSWYLRLNEKLCRMSTGISNSPHPGALPSASSSSSSSSTPQPAVVSILGAMSGIAKGLSDLPKPESSTTSTLQDQQSSSFSSSSSSLLGHIISNVSFMDEHGVHSLQCLVANNMTIDIRVNEKINLCFYSFLEEFDQTIIENDHIFKKSLIMIRAWWTLEVASNYSTSGGSQSLPLLPDESLCIMICAIFNRYHHRIFHPIHALSIFIAEYASFDWTSNALTIFGPISRFSLSDEPPPPSSSSPAGCLDLLNKYREMANESPPCCDDTTTTATHSSSIDGGTNTSGSDGIYSSLSSSSSSSMKQFEIEQYPSPTAPAPAASKQPQQPPQRRSTLVSLFERVEEDEEEETQHNNPLPRSGAAGEGGGGEQPNRRIVSSDSMKILHPIDFNVNTVPESMTDHFVTVFTEIMKKAETTLVSILNMIVMIENAAGDQGFYETLENIFQKFFAVTITRFGQGWKPDLPTSVITEIAAEAESSMDEFMSLLPPPPPFSSDLAHLYFSSRTEIGRDQLAAPVEKMIELIKYSQFLLSAEVG
jgi:hypothetical protein